MENASDNLKMEHLNKQLSRNSCKVELKEVGDKVMAPDQIYEDLCESVVLVGGTSYCSPKCKKVHYGVHQV